MQHYTIFFIIVNALHVSGGFSTHHQELKNYTQHWVYASLLAATASMGELELAHASGSSKQDWHIPDAVSSNSPMLAVAASKIGIYLTLCVQFLSS
jgi:hypothetical protein